jgi:hypothetical protein
VCGTARRGRWDRALKKRSFCGEARRKRRTESGEIGHVTRRIGPTCAGILVAPPFLSSFLSRGGALGPWAAL